jgi:hypothetical protein
VLPVVCGVQAERVVVTSSEGILKVVVAANGHGVRCGLTATMSVLTPGKMA